MIPEPMMQPMEWRESGSGSGKPVHTAFRCEQMRQGCRRSGILEIVVANHVTYSTKHIKAIGYIGPVKE
jgi:hypothetical protein